MVANITCKRQPPHSSTARYHNVEFVTNLSDTVTVLDFGRVLLEGRPDEIMRSPDVQAAYLGAPVDSEPEEAS